ncbi:hypothetical protein F2Q70_00018299 [Brassica cretica]|uniref:Uncharacterized protein n=1 Tax=Brassica cretica TaxID=69181 RepID=A0A8S9QCD0_BRACR|nr:hypothetical protein F2Q70_00018299 [Brassica cretica]KAF2597565.1 hypothetical protein F2Q68_00011547 [Brassica cretica]KAF3540289.1 hypothetical protein F2Q69_00024464 [Brassica cretica]
MRQTSSEDKSQQHYKIVRSQRQTTLQTRIKDPAERAVTTHYSARETTPTSHEEEHRPATQGYEEHNLTIKLLWQDAKGARPLSVLESEPDNATSRPTEKQTRNYSEAIGDKGQHTLQPRHNSHEQQGQSNN